MRQELRKGKQSRSVRKSSQRATHELYTDPPVLDVSEIETNRDLGE